ncbi:ABC transporter permease [Streptomyces sp. NPDC050504]|uniref:ABC transporter permease n=1 Tax=Streptomyces sp. NPDC050504 TaxID=3365618 RepID=UPI0037A5113D
MSAAAPTVPAAPAALTDEPRPRPVDLVASEWLKLWSLRSTTWAYLLTGLAVVAFNVGTAWDVVRYWPKDDPHHADRFIADGLPLHLSFTGNGTFVMLLCLGAIGALPIVGEYGSGLVRTTFAAVPARGSVMAAKAVVVAAVSTGFGAVVALASFSGSQAVLGTRDANIAFGDPGTLRVVVASALLAPLCALTGLALGALLRHAATSMVLATLVLLLLPAMLGERRYWTAVAAHAMPYNAWLRLTETGGAPVPYPWTEAGAWTVYGVWGALAAAVAVLAVRGRDQ